MSDTELPKPATSPASNGSAWYPLFEHMSKNHGLTLLDDELNTIAFMADESRLKSAGAVEWILVNALCHLTCDKLHDLGEAIAKRSGGTYTPKTEMSHSQNNPKRASGNRAPDQERVAVGLHRVVRRLVKMIHADRKEHPFESGQLARLVGRSIESNPWIPGCGPHNGFRAGWQKPPNVEASEPPTRDVNRECGTGCANGGSLR